MEVPLSGKRSWKGDRAGKCSSPEVRPSLAGLYSEVPLSSCPSEVKLLLSNIQLFFLLLMLAASAVFRDTGWGGVRPWVGKQRYQFSLWVTVSGFLT